MITVLHLITSLDTGGAEMMLYKLVERSDRARFRHVVVSLVEPGAVGRRIAALDIPVHTLKVARGVPDPRAVKRLLTMQRLVVPDVVQTWLYHADLLGLVSSIVLATPVVWNIRSTFHHELGLLLSGVVKLCARLSRVPAAVVTNSETARAQHARLGYQPREWLVIPNGFDLERFSPDLATRHAIRHELGIGVETPLIGLIARFHPMKDHRTFLGAARILSYHRSDVHFVLAGSDVTPDNQPLWELIEANALQGRVHLLGERRDVHSLTAALDVATCCSIYGESFPNTVGEAMACVVPCVVTDVGDAASIVGETGRVVPMRDPEALAAAWHGLLELGLQGRQELGRKARARVEEHYSLEAVVHQYEKLYEQLATRSRPHLASATCSPFRRDSGES